MDIPITEMNVARLRKELKARGLDSRGKKAELVLRLASAAEDEISCVCSSKDDAGFMVQCDRCNAWLHGKCLTLPQPLPATWFCPRCEKVEQKKEPRNPKRKREPKTIVVEHDSPPAKKAKPMAQALPSATVPAATANTLPPGWKSALSPAGMTYYYHETTLQTQWNIPTASDAPEPAPQPAAPTVSSTVEVEGVTCTICYESFGGERRPRTLPCGHSLCTPCVAGLCSASPAPGCPVCRQPMTGGMDACKINYTLENVISSLANADPVTNPGPSSPFSGPQPTPTATAGAHVPSDRSHPQHSTSQPRSPCKNKNNNFPQIIPGEDMEIVELLLELGALDPDALGARRLVLRRLERTIVHGDYLCPGGCFTARRFCISSHTGAAFIGCGMRCMHCIVYLETKREAAARSSDMACPCGEMMVVKTSRAAKAFYGCVSWPRCNLTRNVPRSEHASPPSPVDLPSVARQHTSQNSSDACYRCGGMGHWARDCLGLAGYANAFV